MNCPACAATLETLSVEGLAVDVCRSGCGGLWFDNFELHRVDEAHERLAEALLAIPAHPEVIELTNKRPCPKCPDITMLQHKFSREKPVVVDECPNCGGLWLDGGELAEIRRPVVTPEIRRKATEEYLKSLVNAELAELRARKRDEG